MSDEHRQDDHEIGEYMIEEMSRHLYKSPKSAIKEAVSNALDQQGKDARVEIFIGVGEDSDIVIEDWGTGIENYEEFRTAFKGYKVVGEKLSSYQNVDPDIIGNKGLGKLGFLSLSGAEPPTVEFYSHRPKSEKYKAQGMKVTMTPAVKKGFVSEYMDTIEALSHPGAKVVIKKGLLDKLPRETALMQYLSKVFAIRISRGANMFLGGNRITKPEGFDSRAYELFTMDDGTIVRGNLNHKQKSEANNIAIFIKNVYVDSESWEHLVEGWINADFLIPTTGRESIEETDLYREFKEKLTEYLDANYEKKKEEKQTPMVDQKEKEAIVYDLMRYADEKLSGEYDEKGIQGEITGGGKDKSKWIKKENQKITPTGGDGTTVIPIGEGTKGGPTGPSTGGGTNRGIEDGGKKTVVIKESRDGRERDGTVKPKLIWHNGGVGLDKKPAYMENANTIMVNISWPQSVTAWKALTDKKQQRGKEGRLAFAQMIAPAILNYKMGKISENVTAKDWETTVNEYVKHVMDGRSTHG